MDDHRNIITTTSESVFLDPRGVFVIRTAEVGLAHDESIGSYCFELINQQEIFIWKGFSVNPAVQERCVVVALEFANLLLKYEQSPPVTDAGISTSLAHPLSSFIYP